MLPTTPILIALLMNKVNAEDNPLNLVDIKSLTALPLDALLSIKKNVVALEADYTTENPTAKESGPEALPFHGAPTHQQSHYFVDEEIGKPHPKGGVSKVFQTSITSLAFLAFGGYLLFLIIAAIKGKQQNYMYDPNTTQIMQAMINAQLNKRKKKKRRPIRGNGGFGYKGQDSLEFQPYKEKRDLVDSDVDVDRLYQALVDLCEGFRKNTHQ